MREVLHVDGDTNFTTVVSAQMLSRGYSMRGVNDSRRAMPLIVQNEYRVVVLDLESPQSGGLQLLGKIKQYDRSIHVVVLTAQVPGQKLAEALHAGADAVLFKSLDSFDPLAAALDSAFQETDRWWQTLKQLSSSRRNPRSTVGID